MNKFRLLKAEEIECRVQTVTEKGCSLLLYKTARTDADLLDETVGAQLWQNDFKIVDGVLYGGIGIMFPEIDEWIWKWDAGTESNTEAEKGRASDAFKRAGFKWGIGRELYSAPFIWITEVKVEKDVRGKWTTRDKFIVDDISYDKTGKINRLSIVNHKTGNIAYSMGMAKPAPKKKEPEQSLEQLAMNPVVHVMDGELTCIRCLQPIVGVVGKNGVAVSASQVYDSGIERFGKKLCADCQRKEIARK